MKLNLVLFFSFLIFQGASIEGVACTQPAKTTIKQTSKKKVMVALTLKGARKLASIPDHRIVVALQNLKSRKDDILNEDVPTDGASNTP